MICQVCDLDKKISLKSEIFFGGAGTLRENPDAYNENAIIPVSTFHQRQSRCISSIFAKKLDIINFKEIAYHQVADHTRHSRDDIQPFGLMISTLPRGDILNFVVVISTHSRDDNRGSRATNHACMRLTETIERHLCLHIHDRDVEVNHACMNLSEATMIISTCGHMPSLRLG